MKLTAWNFYPTIDAKRITFEDPQELYPLVKHTETITRGNGRSYGDSSLAKTVIDTSKYRHFLGFDKKTGILHVTGGMLLDEIIKIYLPQGWFLPVSPGTKFISVGGAIAADAHGKNQHLKGSFSDHVTDISILDATNNKIINCSKNNNTELFLVTCGGMGLTGPILDAKIQLQKINSANINQTSVKSSNLKETFELFEKYNESTHLAAWIDCLQKGKNIGRSLVIAGDHANDGNLKQKNKLKISVPFYFPSFTLNYLTVKTFNFFYYNRQFKKVEESKVDLDCFLYPLDAIHQWNRIYGEKGFVQYQFVLPKEESYEGLQKILTCIAKSGMGSFLAVLKLFGKGNQNYLSFPQEGYTLALDFKIEPNLFALLDKLDKIMLEHKGRIYLAKDARVSKTTFEKYYKNIDKFRQYRKEKGLDKQFNSLQSIRLGL